MAQNAANHVTWFLAIDLDRLDDLGSIRHWNNLKIGFDERTVWVKDFTNSQIQSMEVKTIPFKSVYALRGNKLFPQGSLLPERNEPALLWTAIDRGLQVTFPALNHHYFGITEKVAVRLVPTEDGLPAYALLADMTSLGAYIPTAAAIRLQHLGWMMVGQSSALIFGSPLLPVPGAVFYRMQDFLVPAGYTFELPGLAGVINGQLNENGKNWVMWHIDGHYTLIPKQQVKPLSVGAFRHSSTT